MTPDERATLRLVNDELEAIALRTETLKRAYEAAKGSTTLTSHILTSFVVWRLSDYYRMDRHLKETRATLLAEEDA